MTVRYECDTCGAEKINDPHAVLIRAGTPTYASYGKVCYPTNITAHLCPACFERFGLSEKLKAKPPEVAPAPKDSADNGLLKILFGRRKASFF